MRGVGALLWHSLRRWRTFLLATAVFLVGFQFCMILVARDMELSGRFKLIAAFMPAFLSQWTNTAAASFAGFALFGYSHPVVELFLIALAIAIGSEPCAEIDTKFIDLVMSRPIARVAPVARTIAMLFVTIAALVACMFVATRIGLATLAPPSARRPPGAVIVSLAVNLAALVLAWGGIALAMASIARRRATVAAACGLSALSMFVLDYVGRFWERAADAAKLSPFHYFDPFALIGGRALAIADVATLLLVFAAAGLVSALAYARRDL